MKTNTKKLKYFDRSMNLKNESGNFNEYDITEEQFSNMPVNKMLKYILHNNKNISNFNEYFYGDLHRYKNNKSSIKKIYVVSPSKKRSKHVKY